MSGGRDCETRGMERVDGRCSLEKCGQAVFGLVSGLAGLLVAELVVQEVWPTFVGLLVGIASGTVVSVLLITDGVRKTGCRSGGIG